MRKAFLKAAREKLLEMRRQILREVSADLEEGRETHKGEGMDTYDLANQPPDREISLILSDPGRDKLQANHDA